MFFCRRVLLKGCKHFLLSIAGVPTLCFAFSNESVAADDANSTEIVAVRVSTNSENDGYEATKAFDGDRKSFWHSQFSSAPFEYAPIQISCWYGCGCVDQHPKRKISRGYEPDRPFELRVDLGSLYELTGFRYWPRADENRNGQVGEYELYALSSVDDSDNSEVKLIELPSISK